MRRVVVFGGVVGVVLLAVIGGILALRGGSGSDDAPDDKPDPRTGATVPDDPEVRGTLDELIAAGRATPYHLKIRVVPVEGEPASDTTLSIEQWSSGGRFREDRTTTGPNGTSRESNSGTGSTARSCQTVNGEQTCTEARSAPPDLPTRFLGGMASREVQLGLTVSDEELLGRSARCFTVVQLGELCLGTDGIPLRVTVEGRTLEVTSIDADVPDSSFDVG